MGLRMSVSTPCLYLHSFFSYHFDFALSTLLDAEREGLLQASLGLTNRKEGLVRSLGRITLSRCQDDFECIGSAQCYVLGQLFVRGEPGSVSGYMIRRVRGQT